MRQCQLMHCKKAITCVTLSRPLKTGQQVELGLLDVPRAVLATLTLLLASHSLESNEKVDPEIAACRDL